MARTQQVARMSTSGIAPRKFFPGRKPVDNKHRQSPFVKEQGLRYELPLLVERKILLAELDTCAARCVIDYNALQRVAKEVKANDSDSAGSQYGSFVIACEEDSTNEVTFVSLAGKKVQSEGTVTLQCAFTDDSTNLTEMIVQVCPVLPDGISLVLSSSFIEHFKLFSENAWRLIPRPDFTQVHPPRVMRMAPARIELPIYLSNYKVNACADTGADLNVISAGFCRRCRKTVHDLEPSDPRYVEFFDRTRAPILGKVFARVFFPANRESDKKSGDSITGEASSSGERQQTTTFYVLSKIISKVTLGAQFLDSVGAFTENVSRLQHVADGERFAVVRKSHKRKHEAIEETHPQSPDEFTNARNRLLSVHVNCDRDIEEQIKYIEGQIASTSTARPSLVTLQADLGRKRQARAELEQTLQHDLQSVSDSFSQRVAASVTPSVPYNEQTPTASLSGSTKNIEKANLILQYWMHHLKPQFQQFFNDPPRDLVERRSRYRELGQDLDTNINLPAKAICALPFSSTWNVLKQIRSDVDRTLKNVRCAENGT